jgi:hypothetical protein
MSGNTEPRSCPPRGPNDSGSGGTRRVLAIVRPAAASTEQEEQRAAWRNELAAREAALSVIRAQLEQQPTARLVRATARRWCTTITQHAAAIAKAKSTEPNE